MNTPELYISIVLGMFSIITIICIHEILNPSKIMAHVKKLTVQLMTAIVRRKWRKIVSAIKKTRKERADQFGDHYPDPFHS